MTQISFSEYEQAIDDDPAPAPQRRLTSETLEAAQEDTDCGYLMDKCFPGNPLVISFNYFTQKEYDFFGRIRKLEKRVGMPFNRIMLRDKQHAWYQRGVAGLGNSVDTVVTRLQHIIDVIRPSKIITMGQSMGGYAAVLFGILLQADRVIAYGALSYLKQEWIERDGDIRWLPLFKALQDNPPPQFYDDLIALAQSRQKLPEMHIITGTNPDGTGGIPNMDAIHARRYASLPAVRSHEYPEARHEVSIWLVENGLMDDLIHEIVSPLCERPTLMEPVQQLIKASSENYARL